MDGLSTGLFVQKWIDRRENIVNNKRRNAASGIIHAREVYACFEYKAKMQTSVKDD